MKTRFLIALALASALSGCASYSYVGDGGGYYHGRAVTTHRYDYGYYYPGASFGLGYGYYGYGYPVYRGHGYGYRPPHVPGRPVPAPVRPPRPHGPHDEDRQPQSDRAPWRNLDRIREGQSFRGPRPVQQGERMGASGGTGPRGEAGPRRRYVPAAGPQGQPVQRPQPQAAPRMVPRAESRSDRPQRPGRRNVIESTKPD